MWQWQWFACFAQRVYIARCCMARHNIPPPIHPLLQYPIPYTKCHPPRALRRRHGRTNEWTIPYQKLKPRATRQPIRITDNGQRTAGNRQWATATLYTMFMFTFAFPSKYCRLLRSSLQSRYPRNFYGHRQRHRHRHRYCCTPLCIFFSTQKSL